MSLVGRDAWDDDDDDDYDNNARKYAANSAVTGVRYPNNVKTTPPTTTPTTTTTTTNALRVASLAATPSLSAAQSVSDSDSARRAPANRLQILRRSAAADTGRTARDDSADENSKRLTPAERESEYERVRAAIFAGEHKANDTSARTNGRRISASVSADSVRVAQQHIRATHSQSPPAPSTSTSAAQTHPIIAELLTGRSNKSKPQANDTAQRNDAADYTRRRMVPLTSNNRAAVEQTPNDGTLVSEWSEWDDEHNDAHDIDTRPRQPTSFVVKQDDFPALKR